MAAKAKHTASCYVCEKSVEHANVMVEDKQWRKEHVVFVRIVCKPCTRKLDIKGPGKKLHSIWELCWLAERPIQIAFEIVSDVERGIPEWHPQAIKDIYAILAELHPKLAGSLDQR